ncbi:MAG: sarcosine oxidase subunit beta family protein [Alphaproteobacteria bacterium]|nr:sarcosine oxidase subunit beta family protein [Alphaproteobacteria bacterium]
MQRYSIFSLLRNALSFHEGWERAWRSPSLKAEYDVVIIGAGGHGLACAYFLTRDHGITNVAVLERGWLGGGNTGRNTTTIRSNYLRDESIKFFDASVQLYENLSRELNFNIMFSQRSQVDVIQTWPKLRDLRRRAMSSDLHGADYRLISADEVYRRVPILADTRHARLPVIGGAVQERAGVARHDAIAWGFARQADAAGVEIHQNTEVTGINRGADGAVTGVETNRGTIRAKKVAIAVAGNTTAVAAMAGLRLPIQTYNLQAFVSEPIKPVVHVQVNCPDAGMYVSQSDKGELLAGGAIDQASSFRRSPRYSVLEDAVTSLMEMFPIFRRVKLMRQWGGSIEFAHDGSPIISTTSVPGLYVSCGWWGGFKAIPIGGRTLAHTVARNEPHPLSAPYLLNRFARLNFILEPGTVTNR